MPINNITQKISELPPAGSRGVDVQSTFVIKQEDFQDHLQGTTVTELNTLKDQLNSRIGEINSTATTMNGYADTASAGASTATTKAGEASTSATAALNSKNQASTFATNSSNSAAKSSQWADNNYNVAVETGKYSAKHWSTVAQNATVNKVDKVTSTDNAIVRFNGTTGEVQNSGATIDDNAVLSVKNIDILSSNNGTAENIIRAGINGSTNGLVVSKDNVTNMTLSYNNQTNTLCFKIDSAGNMLTPYVYNNTTASAANIFMDSTGKFFRSTSSGRYKTDIETIDNTYVNAFFDNARPIYYKSLSNNDNPNWGYWGFIAEEIAEFDKRLVHWRYQTKDVEVEKERTVPVVEELKDDEGNIIQESKDETIEKYIEIETVNDESKPMIAEGVMYERITVLLTAKVQEQQKIIDSLIKRLEILESK